MLADSLYGESGDVITALEQSNLEYIVAIRSNHKVWMFGKERKRSNSWKPYQLETIANGSENHASVVESTASFPFSNHPWWESGHTWKSSLNNLRLIIQPLIFFHLIQPWLSIFPSQHLQLGFSKLINIMNRFRASPFSRNHPKQHLTSIAC